MYALVASRFTWTYKAIAFYKTIAFFIYGKTLRIRDLAVYGLVNGLKAIFASAAFVSAAPSCKSQYTIYTYS